jgi:sigma-B regulation protein RsbU (phosphoserine phosphatase)
MQVSAVDGAHSVAIGAERDIEYTVTRTRLAEGDALFLYTDGVTEALTEGEEFFSVARLEKLLREVAKLPVETITRRVVQDVRRFSGERPQSDDISVLAVRWFGGAGAATLPNPEI